MNKAALIEQMAKDTKMPKSACKRCLESFIKTVESVLRKNKSVVLTGFGTFTVMKRRERVGVNPATGERMRIPARKVPKFKAGIKLRDLIK